MKCFEADKKDANIKSRVENYYKNCNSLTLFGFENFLLGNTKQIDIEKEL